MRECPGPRVGTKPFAPEAADALRDNLLVDYYEDAHAPGLCRYETNRYPYVEVTLDGETFHARAEAWRGNQVMIARITN